MIRRGLFFLQASKQIFDVCGGWLRSPIFVQLIAISTFQVLWRLRSAQLSQSRPDGPGVHAVCFTLHERHVFSQ
jgi:hypothetical protein